jgi:Fe-Mn family superoxide dismutase
MYTLPSLPYDYKDLEPHIDARTMEIHHGKHHQTYVDKTNKALEGSAWVAKPIEEVLAHLADIPEKDRLAVRNHGGGHANHSFFWTIMSPKGGGEPEGILKKMTIQSFGSFETFRKIFTEAALARFGSGWTWLFLDDGMLKIGSTPNQDSPLMGEKIAGIKGVPLLTLDLWEHAYYLKYQNRRAEYVEVWWNVVDWKEVASKLEEAIA